MGWGKFSDGAPLLTKDVVVARRFQNNNLCSCQDFGKFVKDNNISDFRLGILRLSGRHDSSLEITSFHLFQNH